MSKRVEQAKTLLEVAQDLLKEQWQADLGKRHRQAVLEQVMSDVDQSIIRLAMYEEVVE